MIKFSNNQSRREVIEDMIFSRLTKCIHSRNEHFIVVNYFFFNQDGFIKYAPGENYHAYDRGVDMDIFIKDSGGVDDLIGNVSIISITFPFTFFITNIMIVHRNNKDHYYVSVTF